MLTTILFSSESFVFLSSFKSLNIKDTLTIILLVLFGCETWSPIPREEHTLRVLKNWVLRKIV